MTAFFEAGGAVKAMSGAEYTQRQRKIVTEALEMVGFEELPYGTHLHMVEKFTVQLDELLEGMPKDPSKLSGGPVTLAMKCTATAVGVSSKQIEKIKSAAKGKDGYSWLRNRSQIQQSYTVREVLLEALSQPFRAFRGIWGLSDLDKKIDKLDKLIVTSAREELTDKFAPMRAQSMTRKERSAVLEEANLAETKQNARVQATPNSAPLPRGPQT